MLLLFSEYKTVSDNHNSEMNVLYTFI